MIIIKCTNYPKIIFIIQQRSAEELQLAHIDATQEEIKRSINRYSNNQLLNFNNYTRLITLGLKGNTEMPILLSPLLKIVMMKGIFQRFQWTQSSQPTIWPTNCNWSTSTKCHFTLVQLQIGLVSIPMRFTPQKWKKKEDLSKK